MADKFDSSVATPGEGSSSDALDGHEWVYEDMRGNHWAVTWKNDRKQFVSYPMPDAIAAYQGPWHMPQIALGRMFSAALNAPDMVDSIEGNLEEARIALRESERAGSWFWLLVIVGGVYYYEKKGRRR